MVPMLAFVVAATLNIQPVLVIFGYLVVVCPAAVQIVIELQLLEVQALILPLSSWQVTSSGRILEAEVRAEALFDLATAPWTLIIITPDITPMIAITTNSSTRVNPFLNIPTFLLF